VTSSALPPSIYPVNHPTSSPITTVSAGAVNQDQGIWEDAVRSTEAPNQTFLELDDTTNSTNAPSQTPADGEISGKNTGAPSQIPVEAPVAEKWLTEAPAEDDKGKKKDKGDKRKDDNEDDRQDVSSAAGVVVVPVATLAPSQIPVEAPIVEKWLTEAPTEDDKENKKDKDNKEKDDDEEDRQHLSSVAGVVVVPIATFSPTVEDTIEVTFSPTDDVPLIPVVEQESFVKNTTSPPTTLIAEVIAAELYEDADEDADESNKDDYDKNVADEDGGSKNGKDFHEKEEDNDKKKKDKKGKEDEEPKIINLLAGGRRHLSNHENILRVRRRMV